MPSTTPAVSRERAYTGPALLRQGFRPFFLAAAVWAAASIVIWLCILLGDLELPSLFDPLAWHVHEMLYGFVVAAMAGFLLTAVPNWTGRLPIQGLPLLALVLLWLAGRVAVAGSAWLGAWPAAALDLGFLAALLAVVLREIVAGRNWRNLPMTAALVGLLAGNGAMHLESQGLIADEGLGWRLGMAVMVLLLGLIGGRIVPSFTRNWLAKRGPGALPAPFGRYDRIALLALGIALAAWAFRPDAVATGLLLAVAGLLTAFRLARWRGWRTVAEPLVWSLHIGFAWVPVGLLLLALAPLAGWPQAAGIHALSAGAFATMILAVTTRATLGHTGRALTAGPATVAIYALVCVAASLRVAAVFWPAGYEVSLGAAGACWIAAFLGFAAVYGRILLRR
jgi:uncharacterized protein involved in response to NO